MREHKHAHECGRCDVDNLPYEVNWLDNRPWDDDEWGFCDECFEEIQRTGKI